jgi:hypothetical protein
LWLVPIFIVLHVSQAHVTSCGIVQCGEPPLGKGHHFLGTCVRGTEAGVTIAELSEQLLMSAEGIKASVDTLTRYRKRMRTAIRIVTHSP